MPRSGGGCRPRLNQPQPSPSVAGGVLEFQEVPIYPPYYKNGLLVFPLNRSVVLGPYEIKGVNLPCRFPVGSLRECFVTLPNRQVTFILKTDGVRLWGALKNFSGEPQHLMPRYDLVACRSSLQWYRVPDRPVVLIPEGRKGRLLDRINVLDMGTLNKVSSSTEPLE